MLPEPASDVAAPLLPEKEETEVNATIWSSISNMTNNVLGAGLVALAYSVSQVRMNNIVLAVEFFDSRHLPSVHHGCDSLLFAECNCQFVSYRG